MGLLGGGFMRPLKSRNCSQQRSASPHVARTWLAGETRKFWLVTLNAASIAVLRALVHLVSILTTQYGLVIVRSPQNPDSGSPILTALVPAI